ncbi:uncharacterized protein V6R79_005541 [Siganus canaliculatus]
MLYIEGSQPNDWGLLWRQVYDDEDCGDKDNSAGYGQTDQPVQSVNKEVRERKTRYGRNRIWKDLQTLLLSGPSWS